MTRARTLILLAVVGHWIIAIWHLFLAANILPAPNNHVSGLAITLITTGHLIVSIAAWKLSDRFAAAVSLLFFLAAMGANVYEHFLHASLNNIFMVAAGEGTAIFDVSVFLLLTLEILGCVLGVRLLGGRTGNNNYPQSIVGSRHSEIGNPKISGNHVGTLPMPTPAISARKSL